MNTRTMLLDTAERMFADHCDKALLDRAEQGEFPTGLLALVRENGFQQLAMPDSGVELADGLAVMRAAGQFAVPLPLAELILGNRWLGTDELLVSAGPGDGSGAWSVPWGRQADAVISVGSDGSAWVHREFEVTTGVNLAGEACDRISGGRVEPLDLDEDPYVLLCLARAVQMAGGLTQALALSLDYVSEREQFGRPISKFQAIQHYLAVMAAEVAAGIRAADAALAGLEGPRRIPEVAAAKIRVGEAVGTVAELAQQVHGAMGYTHEHRLHHTTRRLWAWRDDYGSERHWQEVLGRHVCGLSADGLWDFVATSE